MNLAAAQDEHARTRPEAPALIDGALRLSHAALADAVRRTAAHLLSLGVLREQLIGVALGDHATHVIVMLALARIGAVMLPIDHRWTAGEQERVAVHFAASVILVEAGAQIVGAPNIAVDDAWHAAVPGTPAIHAGVPARSAALPASNTEAAAVSAAAGTDANAAHAPGGAAPLLVSLSSGTTGRPKGPRITHDHFLARFRTHTVNLGFTASDCFVCATPLYFGAGRTFVWSTLFAGGKVVLAPPPFDPPALLQTLQAEAASTLFLVPTQLRRLLAEHADAPALRQLRLLFSSGAPLTRDERFAIRAHLNPHFCEYYASTEGGGVTLLTPPDIDDHADSVGRAVHGVDVQIVDDAHRLQPPGTTGLLRYRSPGCATAFYRDEEASRESFRDGWFYPGDLAQLDAEGFLTLAGRARDMIIRGGINIYPEEIEAILMAHPAVAEAAVVGVPDAARGEEVVAFVVLRQETDETVLRGWCSERLAPYKLPRDIRRVDTLPRNSSGKVRKDEIRQMALRA